MKGKPFALVGVNSDDLERAKKAVAENKLERRNFHCGEQKTRGPIPTAWKVQGWPTIVVIDAAGRIHYRGHDGDKATEVAKRLVVELAAGSR